MQYDCDEGFTTNSIRYGTVDFVKLILAFLVIAIHYPLTDSFSSIPSMLFYIANPFFTRVAVPYFFITSGFFCFRKVQLDQYSISRPLTSAAKIIKLYLIWSLIYILPSFLKAIIERENLVDFALQNLTTVGLVGINQLWYLRALAIAIILVALLLKSRMSVKGILFISLLFYMVGLLGQSYAGIVRQDSLLDSVLQKYLSIFSTTRNGLFNGFLFVSLGLAASRIKITHKKSTYILLFACSMVLFLIELFVVRKYNWVRENDMYISLIPASWYLFLFTIHTPKDGERQLIFRDLSALLFYTHTFIGAIILNVVGVDLNSVLRYCVVAIASLAVSSIIIYLSKYLPILKQLY